MDRLLKEVETIQIALKAKLEEYYEKEKSFTKESYIRFLSNQYYLNKDVQRDFLIVASHFDFSKRKELRSFLCNFANEEELHYLVAEKDLAELGVKPLPCTLDVELWKAYFAKIIYDRPFVRLGATAILENALSKASAIFDKLLSTASYLKVENMRYLIIHKHEELPHGDQVIAALKNGNLEEKHWLDLQEGARNAGIIYMRFVHWILYGEQLT